jgi:hypothetical protein
VRAIPREKQRSKHAFREASVEAAGLKRKREEQYEKAKQQRKLEGKGPGRPPAVRGPVKQHTAPPVQPQQHSSKEREEQEEDGAQQEGQRACAPGTDEACCWGPAQWGLRNAPEKALRTSTAAQLGVRNGKLFPLKGVCKPRAMHSNNS